MHRSHILFQPLAVLLLLLLGLAPAQWAHAADPVVVTIPEVAGQPGEVVELRLQIAAGTPPPSTLILTLEYNALFLSPAAGHFKELPEGVQESSLEKSSAVRLAPALSDLGFVAWYSFEPPGRSTLAIFSLSGATIPNGHLLTLALRIAPGTSGVQALTIRGNMLPPTSAVDANANPLPLVIREGRVVLGTLPPPEPGCDAFRAKHLALGKLAQQERHTPLALPGATTTAGVHLARAENQLAVRLEGALRLESLWAEVQTEGSAHADVKWVPADKDGGVWLYLDPETSWAAGERILFRAGGTLDTGAEVETLQVFDVLEASAPALPVPALEGGIGEPLSLEPEGVYDTPQTFRLPVPAGVAPESLRLHCLDPASGGVWHPADRVSGWLTSTPIVERVGGGAYIVVELRHGGVVQFAEQTATGIAPAAVVLLAPPGPGTMLVFGLLALALLGGKGRARQAASGAP